MCWINYETEKQRECVLRIYAPMEEKIRLTFNPVKMSDEPDWNPAYEDWNSYENPLVIYKQDFDIVVCHIEKAFPTKDAFDGTEEPRFVVYEPFWLGRSDWKKIVDYVNSELECEESKHSKEENEFLIEFRDWIQEALKHSEIIVVEGNM